MKMEKTNLELAPKRAVDVIYILCHILKLEEVIERYSSIATSTISILMKNTAKKVSSKD